MRVTIRDLLLTHLETTFEHSAWQADVEALHEISRKDRVYVERLTPQERAVLKIREAW